MKNFEIISRNITGSKHFPEILNVTSLLRQLSTIICCVRFNRNCCVIILCMLNKIRSNPRHPLCCALPVPFEPVLMLHVVPWSLDHGCFYAPLPNPSVPHEFYASLSFTIKWSCWQCVRLCVTGGFKEHSQCFLLAWAALSPFVFHCFIINFLSSMGWLCGVWIIGLIKCIHPPQPCNADFHY